MQHDGRRCASRFLEANPERNRTFLCKEHIDCSKTSNSLMAKLFVYLELQMCCNLAPPAVHFLLTNSPTPYPRNPTSTKNLPLRPRAAEDGAKDVEKAIETNPHREKDDISPHDVAAVAEKLDVWFATFLSARITVETRHTCVVLNHFKG